MKKSFLNLRNTGASLVLIAAAFTFHSCSRALDEKVYSQVAVDQFYQTVDQAQLALNGVYGNTLWNDPYRDGQMVTLGDVTAGTLIGGGSANGSGDRSGIITD